MVIIIAFMIFVVVLQNLIFRLEADQVETLQLDVCYTNFILEDPILFILNFDNKTQSKGS